MTKSTRGHSGHQAVATSLAQVSRADIITRAVAHFAKADAEYGERVTAAVAELRA